MSLGLNIGFGVDGISGAYSANYGVERRSSNRATRQVVTSVTKTTELRYALVADRTRIKLSDAFRAKVLALRDLHLIHLLTDEAVGALVDLFGTHYPYAVTYGGMAYLETDYSETVVGHMRANKESFEQRSSIEFSEQSGSNGCDCAIGGGGLKGSLGVDAKTQKERELNTELKQSDDSHLFGTYGGSLSRGEGWTLSPGQEVPLLFDLRPLHELLSPIFFDDPIIWNFIEPILEKQTAAYLRRVIEGAKQTTQPKWFNATVQAELGTHEPRVFKHAYKGRR